MKLVATAVLLLALSGFAAPQHDAPGQINRARTALQNARTELSSAGTEWGGHRLNAIRHIDAALTELQRADQWAKAHHDIK